MRATSWVPDPEVPLLAFSWETTWLPQSATGFTEWTQGLLIDMAGLGHALHAAIRPAALLPLEASSQDPFVVAQRQIEFESARMMQAQILFPSKALSVCRFVTPSTRPSNVATRKSANCGERCRKAWAYDLPDTEQASLEASPTT
jgi:hypothetical protein